LNILKKRKKFFRAKNIIYKIGGNFLLLRLLTFGVRDFGGLKINFILNGNLGKETKIRES